MSTRFFLLAFFLLYKYTLILMKCNTMLHFVIANYVEL